MPKLAKVIREAKIALARCSTLHRHGQRVDTATKKLEVVALCREIAHIRTRS
jgi:hypothetical protein